jgi:hypothetical protein
MGMVERRGGKVPFTEGELTAMRGRLTAEEASAAVHARVGLADLS